MNEKKINIMAKAMAKSKDEVADLGMEKIEKKPKAKKEARTEHIAVYIKPSEREKFLKKIGRKSESTVIRDLILDYLKL